MTTLFGVILTFALNSIAGIVLMLIQVQMAQPLPEMVGSVVFLACIAGGIALTARSLIGFHLARIAFPLAAICLPVTWAIGITNGLLQWGDGFRLGYAVVLELSFLVTSVMIWMPGTRARLLTRPDRGGAMAPLGPG